MNMIKDEIKELFQQKSELFDSTENKRRLAMWGPNVYHDVYSPGLLMPYPACKRKEKRVPVTADWDRMQKSILLKFDISEYYRDPLSYLKWTLKIDIHRFENFPDDTPLLKSIPIFLGIAFEPSLFGMPVIYSSEHEPLFTSEDRVIKSKSDLAKLKMPDFKKSGLMPLAHRFYDEINELSPNDYSVIFPIWGRSPIGVAFALRSMTDLLIDMIEDPPFVHQLMRFIVDVRKDYTSYRREFTGRNDGESDLWNDEASTPILSPKLYKEFCFPYENELSNLYRGIRFWHSCGSKTDFISSLKNFSPPISFMDLYWRCDDFLKAIKELNGEIPYHVRPSADDITQRNESIIANNINGIMKLCGDDNYIFRVDGYEPDFPTEEDVNIMKRYITLVKEIGNKNAEIN